MASFPNSENNSSESPVLNANDSEHSPSLRLKTSKSFLAGLPIKIKESEFYASTDEKERDLIRFELNCALQHFLELERPIFLESLGLFVPQRKERQMGYPSEQALIVRSEVVRCVTFEKTDDFNPDSLQNFEGISSEKSKVVELQELAHRIYPKLPVVMHIKWNEQGFRSLLRAYLNYIRDRLVDLGFSANLSTLGTLYAMHNRQGQSEKDWFAGADIQLFPRRAQVVEVLSSKLFGRPVLESAFEPLQALYGDAVVEYKLNPDYELGALGVESPQPESPFSVAVFRHFYQTNSKPRLIFCTEGLRNYAHSVNPDSVGTELIVQVPEEELSTDPSELDLKAQNFAHRLLGLGWSMLLGTKGKNLRVGLGISCESPVINFERTAITGVVANSVGPFTGEHLSKEGEFAYAHLLGITNAEAKLISSGKRLHLLALLDLRGFGRESSYKRKCILAQTKI
jgi:hypothetical protein